ncbi:MFS transporter [Rheinheimera soli]|uniref:Na+/melibiose symporter-like transporter n=1 Tax=Rheinheimera soli TaxID=443616 RepID=A0ABU1VWX9_9GAMM|nr:MFS transporter [Rheinheimera soli]MDR7120197.1 Na+/melibiose symporter-like transporter [Rheinheimera soli]
MAKPLHQSTTPSASTSGSIRVSGTQKLALGAGFFAMFFAQQSVSVLAIPFYQMTLGVDPFLLGLALTLPLLLGTLLGPWVGHLSDHYQSRFGRRRPFILVASWACCLFFGLIWMVPSGWGELAHLLYFVVFSLLFYVAATFMSVPMTCLSYEMSPDYHQRTEIMGFTTYFLKLGSLLYQWLFPLAQLAIFSSVFVGIRYVGWGVALFIFGLLGTLAACYSKEVVHRSAVTFPPVTLGQSLKTLKSNKGLRVLLLLTVLQMAGGAFTASMDYYLLVYFIADGDIAQGAIFKGWLSMAYAAFGFLTVPLIYALSSRVGKIKAMQLIYAVTLAGGACKWFIFTPEGYGWIWLDALLCTAAWTAMTMLIPSMMADLCDEDELKHGQRREGVFVAIHSWVTSLSAALALLIAGLSLNLIGFDAQQAAAQNPDSIFAMRVILALGTMLFALCSLLIVRGYHLDAQGSQQISLALAKTKDQNQGSESI